MKRATLLALTVSACLLTGCTNALKDGTGYLEDGNYKEAVTAFQKAVDRRQEDGGGIPRSGNGVL